MRWKGLEMLYTGHISGALDTSILLELQFTKLVTDCDSIESFSDSIESPAPVGNRDPTTKMARARRQKGT